MKMPQNNFNNKNKANYNYFISDKYKIFFKLSFLIKILIIFQRFLFKLIKNLFILSEYFC